LENAPSETTIDFQGDRFVLRGVIFQHLKLRNNHNRLKYWHDCELPLEKTPNKTCIIWVVFDSHVLCSPCFLPGSWGSQWTRTKFRTLRGGISDLLICPGEMCVCVCVAWKIWCVLSILTQTRRRLVQWWSYLFKTLIFVMFSQDLPLKISTVEVELLPCSSGAIWSGSPPFGGDGGVARCLVRGHEFTHFWGIKQCKSVVIFRDLPLIIVHCLGW